MKAWIFIKYDVKQQLRDRSTLFWMLLFPIILIFGLGTMLSTIFNNDFALPVTDVAYVEQSSDAYRAPLEAFFTDDDMKAFVNLVPYDSVNAAERGVNNGDADVILHLDGSTVRLLYEEPTTVEFDVLEAIIRQYTDVANQQITLAELGIDVPYEPITFIDSESVDLSGRTPTALEYFTVTISIMTALFGAFYITGMLSEEQPMAGSYLRIQAAPVKKIEYRLARTVSRYTIIFLQLVLVFWFSHFVYRSFSLEYVQFGLLFLAWIALALYGTAFGFFIASLPRITRGTKDGIVNSSVAIIMILSGGYVPGFDQVTLDVAPWAKYVLMPIFMRDGILQLLLRGGDVTLFWQSLGWLVLHVTVLTVLSLLLLKGVDRRGLI